MAQPTLETVEIASASGGAKVLVETIGANVAPVSLLAYSTGDGTLEVVTSSSGEELPVRLSATDNAVLDTINTAVVATQAAVEGTLTVAAHAVTNAGTFAVQIVDPSFAVADGNALGEGVLIQGDDGTDRKNINVHATTGDIQVDITHTVTVDNAGLTELAAAINSNKLDINVSSSTVDVMLGTDFSAVLGQASLILTTQADDVVNTSDGLQTTSFGYVFDGTAWDRLRGDATNGMLVNLGTNNDVTITGTVTSTLSAIDNAVLDDIAARTSDPTVFVDSATWTDNTSSHQLVGGIYQSTPQTLTTEQTAPFQITASGYMIVSVTGTVTVAAHAVTNAGTFPVQIVDPSFAVADGNALGEGVLVQGDDGTDRKNIHVDATTGDVQVDVTSIAAQATGGCDFFYHKDLDETKREIKNSAATFYGGQVINLKATPLYLQVFNLAAAAVTVGSTTPDMQFVIPSQGDTNGAGFTLPVPVCGIAMGTGITVACTTNSEGSGAPGANECVVNLFFK